MLFAESRLGKLGSSGTVGRLCELMDDERAGVRSLSAQMVEERNTNLVFVGVRAWLARGYFIPRRVSQRVCGQAPAFCVERCQTWPILDSGQSPMISHCDGFDNGTVTFGIDSTPFFPDSVAIVIL